MALLKATVLFALLTSTLALPNSLSARTTCSRSTRTINGQTYYISCDTDRPGGDYTNTKVDTFEDCITACTSDTRCVSATFHADTSFCYLKDTLTYEATSPGESTVTLGTGCQARTRTLSGRQCVVQCATDYHGNDYSQLQLSSFEACSQACAADARCATAQYHESSGYCYLKDAVGSDVTSDPDVSSIVCASGSLSSTTTTTTTVKGTATPGLGRPVCRAKWTAA